MNPKERRAKEKAELRARILDTARSLFLREGYDAVTMREIARKIGYTVTVIYYHFPDKAALLRELCETDFQELSQRFQRLGKIADPIERLRKIAQAYVSFGLENPQHYRLMFMTARPEPLRKQQEKSDPDQQAYAFLLSVVKEAMAAGSFRADIQDPEIVAQGFWASQHGLIALHLNRTDGDWFDWRPARKTAELLGDAVLRGLARNNQFAQKRTEKEEV